MVIAPFLQHAGVRHREAAIRSLSALDFGRYRESIIHTVRDSSARVSRAATNAILACQVRLLPNETMPLLDSAESEHTRSHGICLIRRLGKWERIQCLLDAINGHESDDLSHLVDAVHQWRCRYNESFVPPSPPILGEVLSSFETVKGTYL